MTTRTNTTKVGWLADEVWKCEDHLKSSQERGGRVKDGEVESRDLEADGELERLAGPSHRPWLKPSSNVKSAASHSCGLAQSARGTGFCEGTLTSC